MSVSTKSLSHKYVGGPKQLLPDEPYRPKAKPYEVDMAWVDDYVRRFRRTVESGVDNE